MPCYMIKSDYFIYSYVLGHEAMQKMAKSNVFISGMRGLGVEIGTTIFFMANSAFMMVYVVGN